MNRRPIDAARGRPLRSLASTAVILAMLAMSIPGSAVARAPQPERAPSPDASRGAPIRAVGVDSVDGVPAPRITRRVSSAFPKLDAAMSSVAEASASGAVTIAAVAGANAVRVDKGRVQAIVDVAPGQADRVVRAIRALGGWVTYQDEAFLQAWLVPAKLDELSGFGGVRGISQAQAPTLLAGDSLTEGLSAMTNADDWHAAGYTGEGVKVAVIDGGFIGFQARQSSGDLPDDLTPKNFVDGQADPGDVDTGTNHGTAVAEIVHDIAPGADLHLIKIGTNGDLAQAVTYAIAQNVDIITTSLGFYNVTPGDGTGFFADLVATARTAGILWTTAASNDREVHYDGPYDDIAPGGNDSHDFGGGENVNYFGPQDGSEDCFRIRNGVQIRVFLKWNDWENVDKDYDLYLFRFDSGTWTQVAASENDQAGTFPRPTEAINHITTGGGQNGRCYGYLIEKFAGGTADLVAVAPKVAPVHFFDRERSLSDLADSPDAMTIAALDAQSGSFPQESYSSEGPAYGLGGAIAGGARTMDLSGYANVDTEAFGPDTFNGTSSATPHVAGAAALVWDANGAFTVDDLEDYLASQAEDKGPGGADPKFGFGRLRLGAPAPPDERPDGHIRVGSSGAFAGDNVYNVSGAGQSKNKKSARGSTVTFEIVAQNDGPGSQNISVESGGNAAGYTVKYFDGATNITAAVIAGTYQTPLLTAGATHLITVTVKIKSSAAAGSKVTRLVTLATATSPNVRDVVKFTAKRS